jgi:CheY-like chemotaxis protein
MDNSETPIDMQTSNGRQDIQQRRVNRNAEKRTPAYRALVVDDNVSICEAVSRILESFGYIVSKAENGIAAMSYLASSQYDLVITDFDLPMMNGYRLSAWLKQESPHTIVVIMTAACQAEINQYMVTGLVDNWLFKPFGADVLSETLDKIGLPTDN